MNIKVFVYEEDGYQPKTVHIYVVDQRNNKGEERKALSSETETQLLPQPLAFFFFFFLRYKDQTGN